jgi:hypothetical protein
LKISPSSFTTSILYPFRKKDLDKDAEEFIVSWARELPTDQPLGNVVHLPEVQAFMPRLMNSATRYFGYRARIIALDQSSFASVAEGWPLA